MSRPRLPAGLRKPLTVDEQLDDTEQRSELARLVLHRLEQHSLVETVQLIGSLANGTADRYSDIDITLHVSGITDRKFANALPELLAQVGPMLIEGWGLAFLPQTFIRTLYFKDYPLFWHVDISCLSDEHENGTDILDVYHWPQIFKIWVSVVKDYLRGEDRTERLTSVMTWADLSEVTGTAAERLSTLLDICGARAKANGAPYRSLFRRCVQLRQEYLS